MPARVLKVIPAGVIEVSSRLTIITPLASGISITMHSKQPQAVIGFSIIEYIVTSLTTPCDPIAAYSLVPLQYPLSGSITRPNLIGWFGPVGLMLNEALQSSQLYAPHNPRRWGLTTQTWFGANDWQSVQ